MINSKTFPSLLNPKEQIITNTIIPNKLLDDQQKIMSCLQTIPILTTMIVLKTSLPINIFPFDSITLSELTKDTTKNNNSLKDSSNEIIGWISRDSSKPGRL